jgi:hypothetical protein
VVDAPFRRLVRVAVTVSVLASELIPGAFAELDPVLLLSTTVGTLIVSVCAVP